MKKQYVKLTSNVSPTLVRHDSMKGDDYLVVPMVMMVEGVHNGSQGPLFYPEEELASLPVVWNAKPTVVYHPELNGEGVSACSPDILDTYAIGMIMNTKWDTNQKRLVAEAWLEKDRMDKVDDRVGKAIENGEMMEVSTGLFLELDETEGDWDGPQGKEHYVGIARNYKPDHLAILPDKIGACSVKDGAGLMRNELAKEAQKDNPDFQKVVTDFLARKGLVENELSHSNIYQQLHSVLRERLSVGGDSYIFVEDVFSNFLVYEHEGKLFRINYGVGDETVSLIGDPKKVVRVTEYRTAEGAVVGNTSKTQPKPKHLTKNINQSIKMKDIVKALIKGPVYNETQAEWLDSLEDDVLEGLKASSDQVATTLNEAAKPADPAPARNVQEYIDQAPEGIRDVMVTMHSRLKQEKAASIAKIMANERNRFTKEELGAKGIGELENILAFLPAEPAPARRVGNFEGQADGMSFNEDSFNEPLVAPSLS